MNPELEAEAMKITEVLVVDLSRVFWDKELQGLAQRLVLPIPKHVVGAAVEKIDQLGLIGRPPSP